MEDVAGQWVIAVVRANLGDLDADWLFQIPGFGPSSAASRTKGLLMAYKLLEMAQQRWRRLNGAHLLPLVRAGVTFIDGVRQERSNEEDREEAA